MKTFIYKILCFTLLLLLLAYTLQWVFDYNLRKSNCSSNYKEWNDIFDSKINADMIIQGNSRAWKHISPGVLDTVLHINSYNLGIDGYNFTMQYYRFLTYLKYNKKPKYIIQTADYITIDKLPYLYSYQQFVPYLYDGTIREAVSHYEGSDWRDLYIPFYKYVHNKDLISCAISSCFDKTTPSSNGKYKGYQTQDSQWDRSFGLFEKNHRNGYVDTIDNPTLRLFDSFVKYCVSNDIRLIFVNSPVYYKATKLLRNRKEIDSVYLSYSVRYAIPYLNYSNDSICFDTLNFYNSQHLNARGARKFNVVFANDIKKIVCSN